MYRSLLTALTCAISLASELPAQPAPLIQPEQLQEDFQTLHTTLEAAHFDLYAATPPSVFSQRRAEIMAQLNEPMSQLDAAIVFQTYTALARHAHARVEFPLQRWFDHVEADGLVLPVDIRIRDGRVWLADHQTGDNDLQASAEILSLNGEPNAVWLARYTRHISADTPHMAYTLLETYLPLVFWIENPALNMVSLQLAQADGVVTTADIALRPLAAFEGSSSSNSPLTLPEHDVRMLDGEIAYLRPGAFTNTTEGESQWDPTSYISRVDAAFERFLDAGAQALILDLRNNPGGSASFSDPLIAWFADRPWRFASQFTVRVSAATTASNAARLADGGGETSRQLAELFASAANGARVSMDLDLQHPRPGTRFERPVYILINRYSYSNATTVAALAQDYGFAVIAGETTADMATTYAAMEHFSLPHSGLAVGYPKAHIIRPNGHSAPHPVTPDIEIEFPVFPGSEDEVLERLRLHIIAEL